MTPTPEQFNAVADWLAECMICGKEHEYHRSHGFGQMTWESPDDGHHYSKRMINPSTIVSSDLVNLLRTAAVSGS
jgi:hypothetical protein